MKALHLAILYFFATTISFSQEIPKQDALKALASLKEVQPDTQRVILLHTIARYLILKSGEDHADLDSALSLANTTEKLSKSASYHGGIANSYQLAAMALREKGQRAEGKNYAEKAVEYSTQHSLKSVLGESLLELYQYYDYRIPTELENKIRIARQAALAFDQADNVARQAFCLKNVGDLLAQVDSIPQAVVTLKKALSLSTSIEEKKLHGIYDLLGYLYSRIGNYEAAIRYGLLAEKTALEVQDTSSQYMTILNRIGISYHRSKDFQRSYEYLKKAFEISHKYQNLESTCVIAQNIVFVLLYMKRSDEALSFANAAYSKLPPDVRNTYSAIIDRAYLLIYLHQKRFVEGRILCDKLLRNVNLNTPTGVQTSLEAIDFLIKDGQLTRAGKTLKAFMPKYREIRAPIAMKAAYDVMFRLDSVKGDYRSAIAHSQKLRHIDDSLNNIQKTRLVQTIAAEFETAKKDQEIERNTNSINLLTQQSRLQKSELARSQLIRNVTLGGLTLLLAILTFLYYQYQAKQKNNKRLQHLLHEKEWLLKEVHHRVKNNLQTVLSLLESQSRKLSNEALDAVQESQNRVYAMSLIHKKLYQSTDVSSINMEDYLRDLVQHLRDSFGSSGNIRFSLQLDPVELDVSQAVPVGLIINEAITNSIKYAFPNAQKNREILISFKNTTDNKVILLITDNGVGMGALKEDTQSLGMKLMRGLTEDIDGKFSIESNHGVTIMIEFAINKPFQKPAAPITPVADAIPHYAKLSSFNRA